MAHRVQLLFCILEIFLSTYLFICLVLVVNLTDIRTPGCSVNRWTAWLYCISIMPWRFSMSSDVTHYYLTTLIAGFLQHSCTFGVQVHHISYWLIDWSVRFRGHLGTRWKKSVRQHSWVCREFGRRYRKRWLRLGDLRAQWNGGLLCGQRASACEETRDWWTG